MISRNRGRPSPASKTFFLCSAPEAVDTIRRMTTDKRSDDHRQADPVREAQSVARSLRRRLEGDGRAGLAAVAKAKAKGAREYPAAPAAGSTPVSQPSPEPTAGAAGYLREPAAPVAPETSLASALKDDLAGRVGVARTAELFDLASGAPDEGVNREEALARIAAEVAGCERCPELARGRTKTVPGQGNPYAQLVFVGEGPGEAEDLQGLAFVGRAGELLTKMIDSIGMTRDQVFICNIVKCRPPSNRTPLPDESANCTPYLMRQLEILRPKVICALGGTAAKWLLQTSDGITKLRGRFYPWRGVQFMPTFHPAYVLRNYTPDTRRKVYEDLLKVKAEIAK
jgi:uracil-DNA glycosylase family 4